MSHASIRPPRLRPRRPRGRAALALLVTASLLAAGCGGGGSGFTPPPPVAVDLGLRSLTEPEAAPVSVTNPLGGVATATAGKATGPFRLAPGTLPATAGPGETIDVDVLFEPVAPGPASGTVEVVFDDGGGGVTVALELSAIAESVVWSATPPTLDFGVVEPGDAVQRSTILLNASALSPVTLTAVLRPNPDFVLLAPALPVTVAPGRTVAVTVRFAPTSGGPADGQLVLGPSNLGGGATVAITASGATPGGETITDFGSQSLDFTGRTPLLQVDVPADAISLCIEGVLPTSGLIGLGELTGPGGKVYENASSTGAYIWTPGVGAWLGQVPNTDKASLQLVPGGGTYTFRLARLTGSASSIAVRAIVETRSPTNAETGVLHLNVWLAEGIVPTAANAAADSRLQAILDRTDAILAQQGLTLGDVDYYDIGDATYDDLSEQELTAMLQLTSSASEERLNLFFVNEVIGGGVVGVSAAVGGPKANGTRASGVASIYEGFSTDTVGLVAAHEIGHYLGLYHTVEQDGTHDFIDDTPECPGDNSTNAECPTAGGGLLMHWLATGGTTLTDGQGLVIRGHAHCGPSTGGAAKPRAPLPEPSTLHLLEVLGLPDGWCATCASCRDAAAKATAADGR